MASRHHAQRENESALAYLTHAILLAQHANIAAGRSAGLPYPGNRARCQPAVRAAQPAQRVASLRAARNRSLSPGINYATPSILCLSIHFGA